MQLDESLYEPSRLNLRMEDFTAALRTGQLDAFLRIVSAITGHTREPTAGQGAAPAVAAAHPRQEALR
jgi:hypothetical protein